MRRWFEIWTLRLQGLLPDLEACSRCGTDLPDQGLVVLSGEAGALCEACAGHGARGSADAARLSREERRWLAAALRTPIARLSDPGPSSGIDRMVRLLFLEFLGRPFRTARFLEARR